MHAVLTQQGPISITSLEIRVFEGIRVSIIFSIREDLALLSEVSYGTYRLFKPNTPSYTEIEIQGLPCPRSDCAPKVSNLPLRSEIAYDLIPKKITIKRLLVANRGSSNGTTTVIQDATNYPRESL